MDAIRVRHAADMERNPHVEAAVQAATDGVQDTRIGGLESMLADAITEIESLRTHVEDLDTSSRSRRRSD